MIILMYTNGAGNFITIRNPNQTLIDSVVNMYPEAILKVYDFKSCEIVTFYNEEFSWIELETKINTNLLNFNDKVKIA